MGSNPIWGSDFFLCPLVVDSLHLPLFPVCYYYYLFILIGCNSQRFPITVNVHKIIIIIINNTKIK